MDREDNRYNCFSLDPYAPYPEVNFDPVVNIDAPGFEEGQDQPFYKDLLHHVAVVLLSISFLTATSSMIGFFLYQIFLFIYRLL